MTNIGERIKILRLERDMSMDLLVSDMNQRLNLQPQWNKSMISRWESGEAEPNLENAKYLSVYFDVSLDYLIGLTDIRTPSRLLAYSRGFKKIKKEEQNK